ncbi:hypothetical protein [Gemmatimonas sp.]|uniref:hypothetical protein n=1 Tax=Gemmatimonas sp. TaxID=1962908 RepID=UPI0025B939D9|nr:hypothetical protein [Gemmatimonas sp.]MCA2991945.1 hypothetical protein [Gemmatimonas sp.]
MQYAEAFRYDRRTVVIRTRTPAGDAYVARDVASGAYAEGASVSAAVRRLRGGR